MVDNTTNNEEYDNTADTSTGAHGAKEPATAHDVGIGGGLGVVGGAVVGALAGGPVGAVIGAIAGGIASAGAVDVVDKRDHDYDRTAQGTHTADTIPATGTYATTNDTVDTRYPVAGNDADYGTTSPQTIQLREEELRANKQQVQAGEVTLHKEVITETRSIDVPVTREEVVIERHAASGSQAASNANFGGSADEVIRVPVMEEQVTLEKTPVVMEEVSVGRRQVTETQHLSDTVRREELRVDGDGNLAEDEVDPGFAPNRNQR